MTKLLIWITLTESTIRMKKIFITFGDGDENLVASAKRLKEQVKSTTYFDEVIAANLSYIKKNCPIEYDRNINFIQNNKRGLGYWIWKSILIKHCLQIFDEGDFIFYADSGCEIGINTKRHFKFLETLACKHGGVFFELPYPEEMWTKADLFEQFSSDKSATYFGNQVQATYFILINNEKSKSLVENWYSICIKNNYHYLNDENSFQRNHESFVEHRHDQSILSCLVKINKFYIYPFCYYFLPEYYFKGSPVLKYFVHQLRNKTGESMINEKALFNTSYSFKKTLFIKYYMGKLSLKIFLLSSKFGINILNFYFYAKRKLIRSKINQT